MEIDSNVSNTAALSRRIRRHLELVADTITGGTISLNGIATTATTLQIEGTVTLAASRRRR